MDSQTPGQAHTHNADTSTPVLQPPVQPTSEGTPRYSLRKQAASFGASAHAARRSSSRITPVPSSGHDAAPIATASTPVATTSKVGKAKSGKAAGKSKQRSAAGAGADRVAKATAAKVKDEPVATVAQLLADGMQRQDRAAKDDGGSAGSPPVPHSAAVAAMRLVASFRCAHAVIRNLVTELQSEDPPDEKPPAGPASATQPAAGPPQQAHAPQMRCHLGSRAPVDTPGGRADATANLLLSSAVRTPTAVASGQRPIQPQSLCAVLHHTQLQQTRLMARLRDTANDPNACGDKRSRRVQIAAELVTTFTNTEQDVLGFFEVRCSCVKIVFWEAPSLVL